MGNGQDHRFGLFSETFHLILFAVHCHCCRYSCCCKYSCHELNILCFAWLIDVCLLFLSSLFHFMLCHLYFIILSFTTFCHSSFCLTLQTSSFSIDSPAYGRPSLGSSYLFERTNDEPVAGSDLSPPSANTDDKKQESANLEMKAE